MREKMHPYSQFGILYLKCHTVQWVYLYICEIHWSYKFVIKNGVVGWIYREKLRMYLRGYLATVPYINVQNWCLLCSRKYSETIHVWKLCVQKWAECSFGLSWTKCMICNYVLAFTSSTVRITMINLLFREQISLGASKPTIFSGPTFSTNHLWRHNWKIRALHIWSWTQITWKIVSVMVIVWIHFMRTDLIRFVSRSWRRCTWTAAAGGRIHWHRWASTKTAQIGYRETKGKHHRWWWFSRGLSGWWGRRYVLTNHYQ